MVTHMTGQADPPFKIAIERHGQPSKKTAFVCGTTYSAWLSKVHTHLNNYGYI